VRGDAGGAQGLQQPTGLVDHLEVSLRGLPARQRVRLHLYTHKRRRNMRTITRSAKAAQYGG
jgi:hypothetical protein